MPSQFEDNYPTAATSGSFLNRACLFVGFEGAVTVYSVSNGV